MFCWATRPVFRRIYLIAHDRHAEKVYLALANVQTCVGQALTYAEDYVPLA